MISAVLADPAARFRVRERILMELIGEIDEAANAVVFPPLPGLPVVTGSILPVEENMAR
jgi:hypothetical protein